MTSRRPLAFVGRSWNPLLALGLPTVVGPLLLAGAYAWATVALSLAVGMAGLVTYAETRAVLRERGLPKAFLAFGVPLAWTLLQGLPLPCAWMEVVAPAATAASVQTLELLPGAQRVCTLSYDPGATHLELLKGLALFVAMCSAWLLAREGDRRSLLKLVALSTVVVALVALGHQLAAAHRVFGLYEPRDVVPPVWGPVLNPNHLSAFVTMGLPLTVVLGLGARELQVRWAWWGGALLLTVSGIATMSRTGIATLVLTQAALWVIVRRRAVSSLRQALPLAGVFVGALVIAVSLYATGLQQELRSQTTTKLELVASAWEFSLREPWLGVGRGAFSAAFVAFEGRLNRFVYSESLPAHWVTEWGYPVGVFTLGLVGWLWLRAFREARSLERRGALLAVASVAVHDLLDFALEMSGIAIVAAVLFGAALPRRRTRRAANSMPAPSRAVAVAWPVAAVLTVVSSIVLGPRLVRTDLAVVTDRLQGMLERRVASSAIDSLLYEALRAHPNEPELVVLASLAALRRDDPAVLRWANRAMRLAPDWAAPHRLAAHFLLRRGRSRQALLEVKEAEARDPYSNRDLMCEVLKHTPEADLVVWSLPHDDPKHAVRHLEAAHYCLARLDASEAADLDAFWLGRDPEAVAPRLRAARDMFRAGNEPDALRAWQAIVRENPAHLEARRVLVEALLARGDAERALEWIEPRDRRQKMLYLRARAFAALGRAEEMRATLEHAKAAVAGDAKPLAALLEFRSELEWELGNQQAGLEAQEAAVRIHSTVPRLERLAKLAEAQGAYLRASLAYTRLCELRPDHPTYCGLADRFRIPR